MIEISYGGGNSGGIAVVSSTCRLNRPEKGTTHEVLFGDRTLEFTYEVRQPAAASSVAVATWPQPAIPPSQAAVVRPAKTFVSDLK